MSEPSDTQLQVGDVGSYESLSGKPNPEELVIIYMPSLAAFIERATELKGSELSESELHRISQVAQAMALPQDVAEKTIADRGGIV